MIKILLFSTQMEKIVWHTTNGLLEWPFVWSTTLRFIFEDL